MLSVPLSDFTVSPPAFEIAADALTAGGSTPSDASAGGIWEGAGRRAGHQVCWRIAGADLELSETSLLPGVALREAERRIRFPSGLLPTLGLAQLPDGSLLVSVAMHAAPPGGVIVRQVHFALAPDPPLVHGAVTPIDSWFAATPTNVPGTIEPVGVALGTAKTAAFDATAEAVGGRAYRTSLVLGGEAAHAVHVTLLLDLDRPEGGVLSLEAPLDEASPEPSPPPPPLGLASSASSFGPPLLPSSRGLPSSPPPVPSPPHPPSASFALSLGQGRGVVTRLLGSVAGSMGLSTAARPAAAAELIAALALLRLPAAAAPTADPAGLPRGLPCALVLTRAGVLRLWALVPPSEGGGGGGEGGACGVGGAPAPQLLMSVQLGPSLGFGGAGAAVGAASLLGGAHLATWQDTWHRDSTLGVAVGAHAHALPLSPPESL